MEYRRRTQWINGIAFLAVVAAAAGLVVWLVDRRKHGHIRVSVETASLSRFTLDRNGSLYYSLTLGMSIKNDGGAAIHYGRLEAEAFFSGARLGAADLIPPFFQPRKSTAAIYPAFHGETGLPDDSAAAARFRRGAKEGYYDIDVKLLARLQLIEQDGGGGGEAVKKHRAMEVSCMVKVPCSAPIGSSSSRFRRTVCDVIL